MLVFSAPLVNFCLPNLLTGSRPPLFPVWIITGLRIGQFVILRYDKISSQNMHCKHKKIRQKSVVKNLPKLFGARNPRNCLCSREQQEALVYILSFFSAQWGQRYVKDLRNAYCPSYQLLVCRKYYSLQYNCIDVGYSQRMSYSGIFGRRK